jgi:UDP-N-acetylglucosamine 2-epimerase (non-hydrolysing)
MKILLSAGARPNLMKIAPLYHHLKSFKAHTIQWIWTGQHSNPTMSQLQFDELRLPAPDYLLEPPANCTSDQLIDFITTSGAQLLQQIKPDWVVVPGDVNATLAMARAANIRQTPLAHVEAGLRSFDNSMPEEHNRIETDALSDALFVSEPSGVENLRNEGISTQKIHYTGNIMLDTLEMLRPQWSTAPLPDPLQHSQPFAVATFHRPANVDTREGLYNVEMSLRAAAERLTVYLPLHPRTEKNLIHLGLLQQWKSIPNLHIGPPMGYIEFVGLVSKSTMVLTDSGGVQEETTYLDVPCCTCRSSTERPITITHGTNTLIPDFSTDHIHSIITDILEGRRKYRKPIDGWDATSASRIADILLNAA